MRDKAKTQVEGDSRHETSGRATCTAKCFLPLAPHLPTRPLATLPRLAALAPLTPLLPSRPPPRSSQARQDGGLGEEGGGGHVPLGVGGRGCGGKWGKWEWPPSGQRRLALPWGKWGLWAPTVN